MKKSELYNTVETLLKEYESQFKSKKSFEQFKSQIDDLIKPKSGGGVVQNPPIVKDDITYHYCRYTGYYLPESEMVMSRGKCKGYSKKAISKWTKAGKSIQSLNDSALTLLLEKKVEYGTAIAQETEELKLLRNKQEYYEDIREEYKDIKLDQ
jgi:hypothetical protein